jgi:hypothetical protein
MALAFGLSAAELAVSATAAASAAVGLYIGVLAYRGLRRHDDPAMWYLSVGLILLTAITYGTAFVGTLLFRLEVLALPQQDVFRLGVRLTQFAGLCCIAYSLSIRGRR